MLWVMARIGLSSGWGAKHRAEFSVVGSEPRFVKYRTADSADRPDGRSSLLLSHQAMLIP